MSNSFLYWYPKLQEAGLESVIPQSILPRSLMVLYDHARAAMMLEDLNFKYSEWDEVLENVHVAAEQIGYPVFIRTDLSSAKHCGPGSYLAKSREDISKILCETVVDNEMKFWMSMDQPRAFIVREFLELDAFFTAFGGLPINREWRFFANKNEVICAHPYWPEEAIQFWEIPEPPDWKEQLAILHAPLHHLEWEDLNEWAIRAAGACDASETWSVDFAKDVNGMWWLIDMAEMKSSYHWPGCENENG